MRYILGVVFLLISLQARSQYSAEAIAWAETKMAVLSDDEKLGQLFMPRAYSLKEKDHYKSIKKLIKENKIGGLCFFQGTPMEQARIINEYQKLTDIPLMIAIDGEWGLGMRFKNDAISFPRQLELGAIQDEQLIYEMGKKIAEHCRRTGVHINFAPVVDVNNNPANPVINDRSFGEDKYNVASKGRAYAKGLEDGNVMACAKHFPGHGDTDVDSHYDLPVITHDIDRIQNIELMPFRALAEEGIGSMMVAHVSMPAIDARENRPTTLSQKAVTGILKEEIGYKGLIMTDALDMKGVAKHFKKGEVEVEALIAGNDLLLLSEDIPKAIKQIKASIDKGVLNWARIDQSVFKILASKYDLGLSQPQKIENLKEIPNDVNDMESVILKEKLVESALTMVKNDHDLVPIKKVKPYKMATLSIGSSKKTTFQKTIAKFVDCDHLFTSKNIGGSAYAALLNQLSKYDKVFVSIHDMSKYESKKFGVTKSMFTLVRELEEKTDVILTVFGSPYSLKYFEKIETLLLAYNEDDINQDKAAQALFGVFDIKGKLPVSATDNLIYGTGLFISGIGRLGYSSPERVGMSSDSLKYIDNLVKEMIDTKAAPGCQVLCAKDGFIVYNKVFGHHTYQKKRKVKHDDVYDLASVTKILASTLSLMKLKDDKKLSIYEPIVNYLPVLDTCNKKTLILEDILAHHAGLRGWVPFYESTRISKSKKKKNKNLWKPDPKYYRKTASDSFNIKVMDDLFMRNDYVDSMYSRIYATSLKEDRDYKYSDLGFYLTHQIIKARSGQRLDSFASAYLYEPLELQNTMFNPAQSVKLNRIPPTENDSYFRDGKVHGYVHDMGAAMLGGVAGHAGLFSNAKDAAVLLQMLLNGGNYAGQDYIDPETVALFTKRHYRSTRRGLGFDMKELGPKKKMNMSQAASDKAFGHLGFTGTTVVVDPEENLIYVFLSNRTYPTMKNYKFGKQNYRPRIHSVLYKSLGYDVSIGNEKLN